MRSLSEDGVLQEYVYTPAEGRLAAYHQGNITLLTNAYKKGQIEAEVFFVIYPIVPEIWGFDPPR